MAPNLLVATLGQSWAVVPEAVLFLSSEADGSAQTHSQDGNDRPRLEPVQQVWVISTDPAGDQRVSQACEKLRRWARLQGVRLRLWWPEGLDDIRTSRDNRHLADLIYRVVLHAHQAAGGGHVYLSLAGGRKTMSAELQQAGRVFGCRALLHIVDRLSAKERQLTANLAPEDLAGQWPPWLKQGVELVVLAENMPRLASLVVEKDLAVEKFPLPESGAVPRSTKLYDTVARHLNQSAEVLANLVRSLAQQTPQGNFRALYLLPPERIQQLQTYRIGVDPQAKSAELRWLRLLPKAELHCHLGGILSVAEMIRVAGSVASRVQRARNSCALFHRELNQLQRLVDKNQLHAIDRWLGRGVNRWKALRKRWPVDEPLGVAGFLLCFSGREELLEQLVFGRLLDPEKFCGVGFPRYEALGDLQGSGLLQSEETLRAAFWVLRGYCRRENIRYLELRCSPLNYTRGELAPEQVVNILVEESRKIRECDVRLIFIASRHRKKEAIQHHVELVDRFKDDSDFRDRFVGFDLAGNEQALPPEEVREYFLPLMEEVVHITIHAGENAPVESIWQAVYHLSADRVGHGLSLPQHPELMRRIVERGIAVELCPSSNRQIVGFPRFGEHQDQYSDKEYPLQAMLDQGVRVTLNTDNPGISRTTLSREFYQAATMTPKGLSLWQVLQLIRNGFRSAFCDYQTRQRLLREAESTELLNDPSSILNISEEPLHELRY